MDPLEIFRPGTFVPVTGGSFSFSLEDLQKIAEAYSPETHEAPLVVGHPKTDDPAFGWVKKLLVQGGKLLAEPAQVAPAFAQMVNDGHFKKISASFFLPTAQENPKKGVYYLRHVGFLGAAAPAVEGLKPASFNGSDAGVITIEFSQKEENGMPTEGKDSQQIADIEKQKKALEQQTADFAGRVKGLDDREKVIAQKELEIKRTGIVSFIDGLAREGKVLPTFKAGLVEFMAGIPEASIIEFADGSNQVKKPGIDWFKDYLAGQPKAIDFSEVAKGESQAKTEKTPEDVAKAAIEFQTAEAKAGREITITQAVAHVSKGGK